MGPHFDSGEVSSTGPRVVYGSSRLGVRVKNPWHGPSNVVGANFRGKTL